ncbi:MAG TPA: beta-L-arabinofuranosidase domain-containing protein [Actinomycetota bacterium]|nr:beta-L-arabinofuranosidase domain-containing protein [Actinomycetota bacterium]
MTEGQEADQVVGSSGPVAASEAGRERLTLRPLPMESITFIDGLWWHRQQVNGSTTIPHGAEMLERAGNLDNMRLAAGLPTSADHFRGPVFMDSDIYKWLEAVGWEFGRSHDKRLLEEADQAISLVERAQQADGYLNSHFQTTDRDRYTDFTEGHELYCAGHLTQAAVAWRRAVGDDRLLVVARKFADHLCDRFLVRKEEGLPGHPEIETALVELFRETHESRYLDLAVELLNRRGHGRLGPGAFGSPYMQDHVPVRDAREVAGHAVRALYLLAGVTDVHIETGEDALFESVLRQWADMTSRKMYLTGGVGSRHRDEAFGDPYELPPDRAYTETCAAIASVHLNWRLLLETGESRYADLIERTLFNAFLPGVALDGSHFFYVNPLQVRRGHDRQPWYYVACCPPNIMRLLASLTHYFATETEAGLQIHQFGSMSVRAGIAGLAVDVVTEYPWDGSVEVVVREAPEQLRAIALRIPNWSESHEVRVNGEVVNAGLGGTGYATVERQWAVGDRLQLGMPLSPATVAPNPRIDAVRGCTAVRRGPLLYCLESVDLPESTDIRDAMLNTGAAIEDGRRADDLGGAVLLTAEMRNRPLPDGAPLYGDIHSMGDGSNFTNELVPYHLWGHRGAGPMRVWIPQAI